MAREAAAGQLERARDALQLGEGQLSSRLNYTLVRINRHAKTEGLEDIVQAAAHGASAWAARSSDLLPILESCMGQVKNVVRKAGELRKKELEVDLIMFRLADAEEKERAETEKAARALDAWLAFAPEEYPPEEYSRVHPTTESAVMGGRR